MAKPEMLSYRQPCPECGKSAQVEFVHADAWSGNKVHTLTVDCPNGPHDLGGRVPQLACPSCGETVNGRQI